MLPNLATRALQLTLMQVLSSADGLPADVCHNLRVEEESASVAH